MKKIFTLFVAFLALTFCAKAQVTIILEAHDVWGDGSGYQLLLDADHNTYGTVIPETGALTTSGDASASVYAEFEYKVPVNADGATTTQNIVFDGSQTITIPAGTYDFCITNPTPGDRIWIAGGGIDPTRADDYVFEDGKIYHFLMGTDGYNDNCTLTITVNPTEPTITVSPASVNFGGVVLGQTGNATLTVTNYLLTAPVTATTATPFSVSADGTTFGNTATLPAADGGTLYLRYTPEAVGTHNGTLTLASEGATTVTVNLSGNAVDCSNTTLPYTYNFDNAAMSDCWSIVDANNDDNTFTFDFASGYAQYKWSTASDADDWLISPVFTLTGSEYCYFEYYGSSSWPEKFQVFAIDANNNNVALTSIIEAGTSDFELEVVDLSALTGSYRIGIHCVSDADQFYFRVRNFSVSGDLPTASMAVSDDELDFGTIAAQSNSNAQMVVLSTTNVNTAIILTTEAPFELSLNGTSFAATQTIPANEELVVNDTVYVRFAPTAAGTFSQNVTITAGTLSETIALTGVSVDCSAATITTFPYVYDFNTGEAPPVCWGYNDADNYTDFYIDETDHLLGFVFPDMLVSPEIQSNTALYFTFDYVTYYGTNGSAFEEPTSFRIGTSSTDMAASSFTWGAEVVPMENDFQTYGAMIPAGTKYIAIDVPSVGNLYDYYINYLIIDNFTLLNEAGMIVNPSSIDFGSIIAGNTSEEQTANVIGAMLTNEITVTAPASFQVSTNNSTYAATATLPAAGGTLYVKYAPTAAGANSGNITLTSGSVSKTIAVTGTAVDCSNAVALPFTEDFESDLSACWQNIDNDGDGYTWANVIGSGMNMSAYEGDGCFYSESYANSTALFPDNWLITPALIIPSEGAKVSWFVAAQDPSYPAEFYEVKVSTSTALNSFTTIFSETLETDEWEQRTVNIPAQFAGQNVYVAFQHHDVSDQFIMKIDYINVTPGVGVEEHTANASIYPNPATNVLNVNATSNITNVEVYNMMGQMVGSYDANDMNTQINTSNFANGVYTIRIQTEEGVINSKFTVAR